MRGILDELHTAMRGLLHAPLFTFVAVASLALGIGANSAIFSLIDQVILKTLPVQRTSGELISGNYFDVLGVKAHLGRLITPDDDITKGGHRVAMKPQMTPGWDAMEDRR